MGSPQNEARQLWAKELALLVEPDAPPRLFLAETEDKRAFVQFFNARRFWAGGALDESPTIWLDMPCQGLKPDEADRAATFFAGHGIEGPSELHAVSPGGGRFMLASWRLNCGADPERAATVALDMLAVVFQLKGDEMLRGGCWDADEE